MGFSLEYKIGQMILSGFRGADAVSAAPMIKAIKEYHLGGVWLTDADSPMGKVEGNIKSPRQLQELTGRLKEASELPLLVAIDGEGGRVIRLKKRYGFPETSSARALGEINIPDLTRRHAKHVADMLQLMGINFNLAPVVDLDINRSNSALAGKDRCFSGDARVVIRHARQVILAHRETGILSCLKHFPGHGSASGDTHRGLVDASAQWRPEELLPFKTLIAEDLADAVLTSHLFIKQMDTQFPITFSAAAIAGVLRRELGFKGVVLSDDLHMGAIRQNYSLEETLERAVNAGVDLLVFSNIEPYEAQLIPTVVRIVKNLVQAGKISEARIGRSFERIMHLKQKLALREGSASGRTQ